MNHNILNLITYFRQQCYALLSVSVLACALLAVACGRHDTVYSGFVDIPPSGWACDEYCGFETAALDSALFRDSVARYDIVLAVRHTDSYPYSDLWLVSRQGDLPVAALPDTIHMRLADKSGRWLGRDNKGIYMYTDTIVRNTCVPELYALQLGHSMPVRQLKGLLGLGLVISRAHIK